MQHNNKRNSPFGLVACLAFSFAMTAPTAHAGLLGGPKKTNTARADMKATRSAARKTKTPPMPDGGRHSGFFTIRDKKSGTSVSHGPGTNLVDHSTTAVKKKKGLLSILFGG